MTNQFVDQERNCKDCDGTFIWSAGEQEFFARNQFTPPRRCVRCRQINKQNKQKEEDKNNQF